MIVMCVLLIAAILGFRASAGLLAVLIVAGAGLALFAQPELGLLTIIVVALTVPLEFSTGTAVSLNPVSLAVPGLTVVWAVAQIRTQRFSLARSQVNRPLFLFLLAVLLSLAVGNAMWNPTVPRSGSFIVVQLAQWALFVFSALAFWLMANLAKSETWLRRATVILLVVGGGLAVLRVTPGLASTFDRFGTIAFIRAPFWILLLGLAAGQLLFNSEIGNGSKLALAVVIGACITYAFRDQQEAASNWVGLAAVILTLFWLRWPQARWPAILLGAVLFFAGGLGTFLWEYAGGDDEWTVSGGSRLVLAGRVIEDTLQNPITGLGPAAYRAYGATRPLNYGYAFWVNPQISAHNNYIDLFSHSGVVGLTFFAWFCVALYRVGRRLRRRPLSGFLRAYVNSMLAVGAASLMIMVLADWILPYVYNIGFPGFQASVLVWLFMGGLVAIEQIDREQANEDGLIDASITTAS